jgi:hypothetical protein
MQLRPPLVLLSSFCKMGRGRALGSRRVLREFMADGKGSHPLRRAARLCCLQEGELRRSSDLLQPGCLAGAFAASTKGGMGTELASVETQSSAGAASVRVTEPSTVAIQLSQSLRLP